MSTVILRDCVFVGQAASFDSDPANALSGRTGEKIASMLLIEMSEFLDFKRVNLNREFPGRWPNTKGDYFRANEGEAMAQLLLCMHWSKYVLIGQHVQRSFSIESDPLTVVHRGDKHFFCLPHTSGLNHWYNSHVNLTRAAESLQHFVYEN